MIHTLSAIAKPVLLMLDPEFAHTCTIKALRLFHSTDAGPSDDPRLSVAALGIQFPNPIGLAAGFDKNAEVQQAMLGFGFGFVEAGTVTPRPQNGNPKPRIFRLKQDRAVINRLGFNNQGLLAAKNRLQASASKWGIRGINIGANKDTANRIQDYVDGLKELAPYAAYVTVNISSPNTPGLRGLQNKSELNDLLTALSTARAELQNAKPLLVKIAPDLDQDALNDIVDLALQHKIDGLIVSNTTLSRPSSLKSSHASEQGGLSGAPLFEPSTEILRAVRKLSKGNLTLIGVGGIATPEQAYAKIKAGASLVQLYTALAYEGPGLVRTLKQGLLRLLERDGLPNISAAIGVSAHSP